MSEELAGTVELTNRRVVAIDGGTATGKGRLISELAMLLRAKGIPVIHLPTSSLYRAFTVSCLEHARPQVRLKKDKDEKQILAEAVDLIRSYSAEKCLELGQKRHIEMHNGVVWMDGSPADEEIVLKGPGVGLGLPTVAGHLVVRNFVNRLTRLQINEFEGYLMIDGRDTTHVIVPDAPLKLLLTVAPHIAASRSLEHSEAEIVARDEADRSHKYGALRRADSPGDGVHVLATDDHTPESVRNHVYLMMRKIFPQLPPL